MEDAFATISRLTRDQLTVSIPEHTPIIEIARAFASIGMTLRNDARGNLVAEPIPDSHKSQSWAGEHYKAVAVHALRQSLESPEVAEERSRS